MPPYLTQPNRWSCGTLAILNAITALGGETDYETVYRAVGNTVRDGTDEYGILEGLIELGYRGWEYKGKNPDSAWRYVSERCGEYPIVLLVDDWRHWVVATGKLGNKVVVVDSDPNKKKNESGALVLSKPELLERWKYRGGFYAIRVSR